MADIANVCVYCGANPGDDPAYAEAARTLGISFAEAGVRLVYGGGSAGLMGEIARAVLKAGGRVTGVIPTFLVEREMMLREADEIVVTRDMHERKRVMFERADAFVAMPGGIGTLEEIVEMMTWAQLGRHEKPILFADFGGFWTPLLALFDHMAAQGFLKPGPARNYLTCGRPEDVIPTLRDAVAALPQSALRAGKDIGEKM